MSKVFENELISNHKIMCPPNIFGEVVKVYGGGTDGKDLFHIDEPVMEVYNEAQNRTHVLNLSHFWPVRRAAVLTCSRMRWRRVAPCAGSKR